MFEGAVQALIRRYAREYLCVDDASLDGLVVSLWSGHMEIEDLELEPQALQQVLGLDLRVRKSKIGKLSVDVPWSKLQSKPVVIRLTGIEIEAEQLQEQEAGSSKKNASQPLEDGDAAASASASEEGARRERVEAKIQRLAQLERIETAAAQAGDDGAVAEGSSFWMKLATKILDNLQLVLQDIRIAVKSPRAQAEVHLDEIALLSVDANWHEAFVQGTDVMRKIARVRNPRVLLGPIDAQSRPQMLEMFRQRSILTKITLHKGPSGPNGSRVTEGVEVELSMEATRVTVDRDQVVALAHLQPAAGGGGGPAGSGTDQHGRSRKRIQEPKWARACRLARAEAQRRIAERKREAWFKACREPYLELFKRTLEATRGWLADLSTKDRNRLELMERSDKLTFAHIVRLRRIAYEEVRMRVGGAVRAVQERRDDPEVRRRRAEARAKAEQAQKGWLSSWWGGGKSNESADPPPEASLEAVRAEVTDEERNRLFDTIGYDPDLEEDDVVDLAKMHLQLRAAVSSIDVRIGPSDDQAARAHLGEVRCEVDFQGSLQKAHLDAESLIVQDDITPNTLFRNVIGPAEDVVGSAEVPYLFVLKVERKDGKRHGPLVVDCHLDQPVRLVYSAPLIEHVLDVVQAPPSDKGSGASGQGAAGLPAGEVAAAEAAADASALDAAPSAWDAYYAAYAGSTIEEMVDWETVPSISVRIQTPRIVVPADVTDPEAPRLEMRLGAFDLSQHSHDTWHLEGADILAKVERNNENGETVWSEDLLSDVSFHSSLVLCTTAPVEDEAPKPRVDVGLEVPSVRMQVNSESLDAILAISQALQQSRGADSGSNSEAQALQAAYADHEVDSGSGSDEDDDVSLPSDPAVLNRLAARIALRFRANLRETSIKCDLPHLRARVSLDKLTSTFIQRTFDSALDFNTGSFAVKDLVSERDVWSPQEDSALVRLQMHTFKPQSPIYEGFTRTVGLKVGAVRVNIPTSFVQGVYSTITDLSQRTSSTSSSSSTSASERVADAKVHAKAKAREKKNVVEERYEFSAEALEVKFLRDNDETQPAQSPPPPPYLILSCEIDAVDAAFTPSSSHARVRSLRAVSADRELLFLSGDQEKSEDVLAVQWSAKEGAVVEVDPIHLVLDQKVFRALLAFKPPDSMFASAEAPAPQASKQRGFTTRSSSSMSSSSSLASSPGPDGAEASGSSVVLKLRRPDAPFVLEILTVDGTACEARAKGLRADKKGIFLEGVSVVLDGSHEVLALEGASFGTESGLIVDKVHAVLNPETRRLAHTLTDAARSVVELTGGLAAAESGPVEESSSGGADFQARIKEVRVVTRDVSNEGGAVLAVREIRYGGTTVQLGGLQLFDEPAEGEIAPSTSSSSASSTASTPAMAKTDMLVWEGDAQTGRVFEVALGEKVVRAKGCAPIYFRLTPKSQAVATTLAHTMLWCGNAVEELTGGSGGGGGGDSGDASTKSDALVFALEMPGATVELESFRPSLGNLRVTTGLTSLAVHENGKVDVHLDDVEFLSTKFPLQLSISLAEADLMQVHVELEKDLELSADPRSLYQLNSALNSNLLLASEARPLYELASEGSTALTFDLTSKGILLKLERPPVEGTEETDVEHFASVKFSGLGVEYDGRTEALEVKSVAASIDSHVRMRPGDPPIIKSVASLDALLVSVQTKMNGGVHQTEIFVDAQQISLSHEPKLLRALFEFQSILESMRTANVLLRDMEAPSKEVQRKKSMQTRLCVKELSVKVAPEDVPGAAIVLRSEVIAIVESTETEDQLSRVVRVTVANANCGLCILGSRQEVLREHPLVDDASVILILRNAYQISGVRLMSSFVLNMNDVSVELQIPMLMRLQRVVNAVLRTMPSRTLVQRAILSETARAQETHDGPELEGFDGTKYEVEVTVGGFDAVVYGKTLPFLRLRIRDNSIASGETVGSSESISSSAFKGSLHVRSIDLCMLNPSNMAWEPMLEPCDVSSEIKTIPQHPHNGLELSVRSARPLRANVHVDHLRRIMEESEDLVAQMQDMVSGTTPTSALKLSNFRRCVVVNKTDMSATVNEDTEVPPNGEAAVQTASMRLKIRIAEQFLEVPLVDRKDQAIGSARLGAWVEHQADKEADDVTSQSGDESERGAGSGFIVTLASGLVCCNECDMTLHMAVLVEGEPQMEQAVGPGRRFYIPPFFNLHSCDLVVRLSDSDNWSMVQLQYDANSRRDETALVSLADHSAVVVADVVRNECRPLCRVHIRPYSVLENELPIALRAQLIERPENAKQGRLVAEREIASGTLWGLTPSDPADLYVRFAFLNAPEVFGPLMRVGPGRGTHIYAIVDRGSRRSQQLRLRVSARGISIFAPFWVVNGTGLDLMLAREDATELLDAPVAGSVLRTVEETWENQRMFIGQGWVQRMLPGERPVWSNKDGTKERLRESVRLPQRDPGWAWETDWTVDTNSPNSNADGWMYSNAFSGDSWYPEESWTRMIRRRRWVRTRYKPVMQDDGDAAEDFGAASTSTRVFGFEACRVGLKQGRGAGEVAWSTPCPLDFTVGTSNVFPMRRSTEEGDSSFYELVLSLSEHPTLARTKLCTVSPRVVLVNQVGMVVRVIQANTIQDPIVLEEDPAPLWWCEPLSSASGARLQIQLGGSSWSAAFPIHTLDEFCMFVPGYDGRVVVEVRRGAVEATVLVVFRADSQAQPMYRIENVSLERLKCTQRGADTDSGSTVTVRPYDTAPFAWSEPLKDHLLRLEIGGYGGGGAKSTVSATVDLTQIGRETRVALPPQHVTAEDGGAADEKCVCAGLRHFLHGPGETRWVARAPPPVAESVLSDGDIAGRRRAWTLGLSQGQATAIVFATEEKVDNNGDADTERRGQPVRYGDRVQILTRTSDGLERRLTQTSGTEVGWTLVSSSVGVTDHDQGDGAAAAASSQAQSEAADPRMWWTFTGKATGELVELTDAFGISTAPRRDGEVGSMFLAQAEGGSSRAALTLRVRAGVSDDAGEKAAKERVFGASALRNIRNLEARTVFVIVDVDSRSRIVRIMETSLSGSSAEDSSSEESVAEMTRLRLGLDLDDVGVSIISRTTNTFPTELAYLTGKLSFQFHDTNLNRGLDVVLQSMRIDNCTDDPTYANLLKRSYVGEEPKALPPVLAFSMHEKHTQLNVRYIRALSVRLAKMDVQVDEAFIEACKDMAAQVSTPRRAALTDAAGPSLAERRKSPRDLAVQQSMDLYAQCERGLEKRDAAGVRFLYVRAMTLGKLELRISYFRSKVTDLEGAPVVLDAFEREHLATTRARLLDDIRVFYRGEIQGRVLRIIGYALPGNPGELLSALGTNPGNAMHAALASIGSLGATVAKVDLDYKKKRGSKPRGVEEGFSQGGKQVREGFRSGFAGLLSKPREGAAKGGALGAVEGVGSGLYGLIAKPVSGMASAVASTSEGIAARGKAPGVLESERQLHVRTRPRRLFPGVQGGKELVVFDMFHTCLISKCLRAVREAREASSGKASAGNTVYVADYVIDSSFALVLVHTQTHVALLTYSRSGPDSGDSGSSRASSSAGGRGGGGAPPPPPRSDKAAPHGWLLSGPEQREFEKLEKQVGAKVLWLESRSIPTTHNVDAALRAWQERLGSRSLVQCEKVVQRACTRLRESLNGGESASSAVKQLADRVSERVGVLVSPSKNAHELEAVLQQARQMGVSEEDLEQVLALSKLSERSPVVVLALVRAYAEHPRSIEAFEHALARMATTSSSSS